MAESRQTTIRFAEMMYRRLEVAGEVTGLPINSIVVIACLEWLDAHQPDKTGVAAVGSLPLAMGRWLPSGFRRSSVAFGRFTERAKRVLALAQAEAERASLGYIGDEHLLVALADELGSLASDALRDVGLAADRLRQVTAAVLADRGASHVAGVGSPSPQFKKVMDGAFKEAQRRHHQYVGTEHLLLSLIAEDETTTAAVLARAGVPRERVRSELERIMVEAKAD